MRIVNTPAFFAFAADIGDCLSIGRPGNARFIPEGKIGNLARLSGSYVEQSEQIFTALKLRGIATRFVRYPDSTSHGMSRMGPPDLRIHRLKQYLDWWSTYLK